MKGLRLIATGGALPGRTVTNEELSRTVDTSDEWITTRTGIRTRHYCTEGENAATLAIAAAKQALQRSGLAPADIACCVCATLSAPDATPSVACQVQAALALPENRPALDVNAACSGFLYGTAVARGLLATLGGRYALVIGTEALSRLMDPADRSTCVLFGDGAGAAVFELTDTSVPFAITLGAMDSEQSGALDAAVTRGAFARMLTSYSTYRESVSSQGAVGTLYTDLPGSSAVFRGGVVSYTNEIKERLLKVDHQLLEEKTAVCEEVARQMVQGAMDLLNVDFAIASTGIAGPGGGTKDTPVGTIWLAYGNREEIRTQKLSDDFGRDINIAIATNKAMRLMHHFLEEKLPQDLPESIESRW